MPNVEWDRKRPISEIKPGPTSKRPGPGPKGKLARRELPGLTSGQTNDEPYGEQSGAEQQTPAQHNADWPVPARRIKARDLKGKTKGKGNSRTSAHGDLADQLRRFADPDIAARH